MSKKEIIIGGYDMPRMKLWDYDIPEELPNDSCLGAMAMVNGKLVFYSDKDNTWSELANDGKSVVVKYFKCDRCEKWIDSSLIACPHCGLVDSAFI